MYFFSQEDGGDKKKDDKKDKVKTAKKIAKDMEKWAKTLNQRKEAAKVNQPATAAPAPSAGASRGGGLEDLAFSMFTKQVTPSGASKQISAPKAPEAAVAGPSASGLAGLASYGSDSDNDDQVCFLFHFCFQASVDAVPCT
jgi:RNA-binding protein 5/10